MAKMGRPRKEIDSVQLKALMRLKPTIADTAAFFECSPDLIEIRIKKEYGVTFSVFRDQNMVHTRFSLIRKAIQKAEGGDNCMLIFCLKNLCGWRDKYDNDGDKTDKVYSAEDLKVISDLIKKGLPAK